MEGFGKYIRLAIAALAGAGVGYLVSFLATNGIEVPAGQVEALTAFVTLVVYSVVAKFLKRFPWLDLEGFAEREQTKADAAIMRSRRP